MTGLFARDARDILDLEGHALVSAMAESSRLRERRHGRSVNLCWIANARSGSCDQDCAFCAQSSRSEAPIEKHPLLGADEIVRAARKAADGGAVRFSIVTSGGAMRRGSMLDTVLAAIARIRNETGLDVCASLGCVERGVLDDLKRAGLTRYHHNVEAAESFWPRVCSTRPYAEQRRVVGDAAAAGLEVCCGGIFGMGESLDQRIELLEEVRALEVDSVAINFFTPISGTPLGGIAPIPALDCLRVVIAARMMMPRRDIRVCGGRERNVRDIQALLLLGGASGIMIGGYLTTTGRPPEEDLAMIRDLGFVPDEIPEGRDTVSAPEPESRRA
ncbi:MAG: biotin synthase BioB [Proteobacteria bacterium]|jgi:biotin synthase|nr:biotin synthase BioB [Pseudomonadota bacterium]